MANETDSDQPVKLPANDDDDTAVSSSSLAGSLTGWSESVSFAMVPGTGAARETRERSREMRAQERRRRREGGEREDEKDDDR